MKIKIRAALAALFCALVTLACVTLQAGGVDPPQGPSSHFGTVDFTGATTVAAPTTAAAGHAKIFFDTTKTKLQQSLDTGAWADVGGVAATRAINTTSPLAGGGDLSADLTLTLGTVPATKGGTGQTTATTGDLFYASAANTISKLPIGSSTNVLTVTGGVPAWAAAAGGTTSVTAWPLAQWATSLGARSYTAGAGHLNGPTDQDYVAQSAPARDLRLQTANTTGSNPGNIQLQPGQLNGDASTAGNVTVNGTAAAGYGGYVSLQGGNGSTHDGGSVSMTGGDGATSSGTGQGGSVAMRGGNPHGTDRASPGAIIDTGWCTGSGATNTSIQFALPSPGGGSGTTQRTSSTRYRMTPVEFRPNAQGAVNLGKSNLGFGGLWLDYVNTATVGDVTINTPTGTVNMAAVGSTLTVTDSIVTANSHVMITLSSDPGVALSVWTVASAGSFTINTRPAVVNQTAINFLVIGAD